MIADRFNGSHRDGPSRPFSADGGDEGRDRIEYAKKCIEEMSTKAIHAKQSGMIGIEISIKDGKLGIVKRLLVDLQPE